MDYDVIIIGAGPGGIFSAYELTKLKPDLKIGLFELGKSLEKRVCPIASGKVKSCINCKVCSIMSGFGGAGAFSDGKYVITNDYGGDLHKHIGQEQATKLMQYVDNINLEFGGKDKKLYSTENTPIRELCEQNNLKLLKAQVRHLGTDVNYLVLNNLFKYLQNNIDFHFETPVKHVKKLDGGYLVVTDKGELTCVKLIISVGRSGSSWMQNICEELGIESQSNRVDIGVRVEMPAKIFAHITDETYESKIVFKTTKYQDNVRTFCMNPNGVVVNENTNGIKTVNGHSFEDASKKTQNTNFALLVSQHFSEPFKDGNEYAESIAKLSNMLGGGVIVQKFGDLIHGQRSTVKRLEECSIKPTLSATPGDLSLVLPKRILDDIIEMIFALDKIAPGTASYDTLLYGVEVKFYNMEVQVDNNLETKLPGLYIIGDGSGVTHSLSHASASGVYVARQIAQKM